MWAHLDVVSALFRTRSAQISHCENATAVFVRFVLFFFNFLVCCSFPGHWHYERYICRHHFAATKLPEWNVCSRRYFCFVSFVCLLFFHSHVLSYCLCHKGSCTVRAVRPRCAAVAAGKGSGKQLVLCGHSLGGTPATWFYLFSLPSPSHRFLSLSLLALSALDLIFDVLCMCGHRCRSAACHAAHPRGARVTARRRCRR